MAIVRLHELKEMNEADLKAKLAEVEKELRAEAGAVKTTGKPSNAGKYKELKKVRARINTLLRIKGKPEATGGPHAHKPAKHSAFLASQKKSAETRVLRAKEKAKPFKQPAAKESSQ